jgi:DNA segregation ATPase FtsK/SpoIIIE-like protein
MKRDPLFSEARKLFARTGRPSTTHLQTRFSIGYAHAARLMQQLMDAGHVLAAERARGASQDLKKAPGTKVRRPVDFSPEHLELLLDLARAVQKKIGGKVDISKPLAAIISNYQSSRTKNA